MKVSFEDILLAEGDILKKELVDKLRKDRPILNKFIVSLFRQRRLQIETDPQTSESSTEISPDEKVNKTNYKIKLGLEDLKIGTLERQIFNPFYFKNDELLQFKLLHELSYCIYDELGLKNNSYLKTLKTLSKNQITQDRKFYTLNGSYSAAINKLDLVQEDIVELLAIYLWDSKYFKLYIKYLVDPLKEESRKAFAIKTLTISSANVLVTLVENITNTMVPNPPKAS